ncbi:MAG: asparagine synthase (glutamine-hydrolyzing) [Bacilli bacterium]
MCGIAGIINYDNRKVERKDIKNILKAIKHRGPDGEGIFIDSNIGLGHVLLKIQDTTDNSKQPFLFKEYCLTYNGEIYNYKKLRELLKRKGYTFNTDGDTEVLIKMIDAFGLENTLEKIEGCYAFCLYNKNTKKIQIVRDRFGIKPVYYFNDKKRFIFSSEIKGIIACDDVPRVFNINKVLVSLNTKLWLDNETTLFKNIYAVKPGHYIEIVDNKIIDYEYYKLHFEDKYKNPNDVIKNFGKEFEESVKKKLISKVPVAAFLSGGLDSSIVCKLLNDYSKQPLNTYTICYDFDNDLDLNHANELAKRDKFVQHNILIKENMYSIDNIDKVTYGVEEILIDKVYIPMYYNYKAAKQDGFTVVVSGQGSDEVWLGYIFTWKIFKFLNEKYDKKILLSDYYKNNMIFKEKLNEKYDRESTDIMNIYLQENFEENTDQLNSYGDLSLKTILHDLLIQEDKIAMMNSIESRVPFVDNHKIVEIAYKTSSKIKTFDGREKYIVRKYCEGKINDSIINREKYPFPEPPKVYNTYITELCKKNWKEISNSKILKKIIKKELFKDINNFNEVEQWWLLAYWRFENVFEMRTR